MPHLLDPIMIRGLTISNRIFVSPMCEYSSDDGFANEWHLVHLARIVRFIPEQPAQYLRAAPHGTRMRPPRHRDTEPNQNRTEG